MSMAGEPSQTDGPCNKREQRRQAIVETAARLFAEHGYTSCDMECLAVELGIAKGTLYLYFPGKQDLFYACVDWGMQAMQKAVRAAADSTEDPFDKLSKGIRAYLAFFDEHPHYVELLIQERAIFKDRKRPTYFEYREANRAYWRDLYGSLIAEGRMRADLPVERILDAIGNMLYGTMYTNHFIGRTVSLDEQYQSLLKVILTGILSDKERVHADPPAPSA